jgi:hypothetical protein
MVSNTRYPWQSSELVAKRMENGWKTVEEAAKAVGCSSDRWLWWERGLELVPGRYVQRIGWFSLLPNRPNLKEVEVDEIVMRLARQWMEDLRRERQEKAAQERTGRMKKLEKMLRNISGSKRKTIYPAEYPLLREFGIPVPPVEAAVFQDWLIHATLDLSCLLYPMPGDDTAPEVV